MATASKNMNNFFCELVEHLNILRNLFSGEQIEINKGREFKEFEDEFYDTKIPTYTQDRNSLKKDGINVLNDYHKAFKEKKLDVLNEA